MPIQRYNFKKVLVNGATSFPKGTLYDSGTIFGFRLIHSMLILQKNQINTMKKIVTIAALMIGAGAIAQSPQISSAIIALRNPGGLAEAKEHISEAALIIEKKGEGNVREKDLTKFYLYQGIINLQIATSEDPAIKALDANALEKSKTAIEKLLSYEKQAGKERYSEEGRQKLPLIANQIATQGIEASNEKKYGEAYDKFLETYNFKKKYLNSTDTSMYYNAALMAQNDGKTEEALKIYQDLMQMEYKGLRYTATEIETGQQQEFANQDELDLVMKSGKFKDAKVEGDVRPDLYITAANLNKKAGDTAKYDQLVAEGRQKFPDNESLLRAELQTFLDNKNYDKALANLNSAIAKNPDDKLFHYIKGYILQTSMDSNEAAKEAYRAAIALDDDYLDPRYMMGLIHIERANELTEEMNKLKLSEKTKYNKLQEEQKKEFGAALPHFEKAHAIDPQDRDTLNALKEVYYKLRMLEKAQETQAKIDALG